ncbi:MAG: hypothetical protein ACT4OE_03230 [Sphingosinicella sp.]
MRTILLVIALLIVIAIALIFTGVINLQRASDGSVRITTPDVQVGTTPTNVQVPVVRMENRSVELPSVAVDSKAGNQAQPQTNQQ